MTEKMMLFRDLTTLRQNIERELTDASSQIVYGNEPNLEYSKNYILSEIAAVLDYWIAKNRLKDTKKE